MFFLYYIYFSYFYFCYIFFILNIFGFLIFIEDKLNFESRLYDLIELECKGLVMNDKVKIKVIE